MVNIPPPENPPPVFFLFKTKKTDIYLATLLVVVSDGFLLAFAWVLGLLESFSMVCLPMGCWFLDCLGWLLVLLWFLAVFDWSSGFWSFCRFFLWFVRAVGLGCLGAVRFAGFGFWLVLLAFVWVLGLEGWGFCGLFGLLVFGLGLFWGFVRTPRSPVCVACFAYFDSWS